VSVPVCRTVEEAYQAGIRDALADPKATTELAERIASMLAPWLEALAASRGPRLLSVAQAAEQLGMSPPKLYDLVYKGEIASVQIPSSSRRNTRRIEQAAIDAFIEQHRVDGATTAGGVPPPGGWPEPDRSRAVRRAPRRTGR
jgi:excisionase family DNA binding protein